MESFFGSPWDFGTGFAPQQSFMPGTMNQPVMPQVDFAGQMAQGLASQGIRPQQFFSNPAVAQDLFQPPAAGTNPWDATPVGTPGGSPTPLPMPASPQAESALAAAPGQVGAAKEKTMSEKFAEGLRGVKMPAKPEVQKVSTPALRQQASTVKPGELLALLLGMQPGGGAAAGVHPSLGGALQGMFR